MKRKTYIGLVALTVLTAAIFFINNKRTSSAPALYSKQEEKEEHKARFAQERLRYEFDMLKDPATGKLPYRIFEQEIAFARTLPSREDVSILSRPSQPTVLNSYLPAGPNNIGARTRAVAYDVRYNGSTNRTILAGSVSGGILRSTNGGQNWVRVSPENEIHNLTSLAQDTRPGFQDTWYAGGGEAYGNTANEVGATYLGYGIYKSTNNGASWVKLPLNTITSLAGTGLVAPGTLEGFDHPFDFVHKVAVNPVNGHLYIAGHRRLVKSIDGGVTFRVVFESATSALSINGQMDIAISTTGRLVLAVNGGAASLDRRGVWLSATGDVDSWTRIAGGNTLGIDSVDGWRANSYEIIQQVTVTQYSSKRILVALAPSNQNMAYVYYENGLSSNAPTLKPETDLFQLNMTGGITAWSNRSDNLPDFPGGNVSGSDPLAVQNGYDMLVKVLPSDPNTVFVGGTNLYRSSDGFATKNNIAWINGYRTIGESYTAYPNGHADIHELVFNPANPVEAICGNDGGVQSTSNITAGSGAFITTPVTWTMLPNYQTLQYYYVAIDPTNGRNNFIGGAQDNGTRLRDKSGIFSVPADSNNHVPLFGGDGTAVGFSKINTANQAQYVYYAAQFGNIRRRQLTPTQAVDSIRPAGLTPATAGSASEFGEFITNYRLNPDNTEDLYYVNFNRLFRATTASTVTMVNGWTELTGVGQAVNSANGRDISIRGMGFSRGPYSSANALYLGTTNGKLFRLDDPRNTAASTQPVDITPPLLTGQTTLGNVQDIAVNPNNDAEIMAVVSNYGTVSIWWTANAKSATPTWKNAEGNLTLPSIRSCAIITKKDAANQPVTEYYVGTSVGLYSTTNIGTGTPVWQREGGNVLNFAVVQSLAYRPGDNVLLVGTHGNGMYYTFLGNSNVVTGIDPVINNRNFITNVYPTAASQIINYQVGSMPGIRTVVVQIISVTGQIIVTKETAYANGSININRYASGAYVLSIISADGRYRHIQKIVKK